jgi:hypothetical protein
MEGLTGTREEIIADQITDAMKVMGTTKTGDDGAHAQGLMPRASSHPRE